MKIYNPIIKRIADIIVSLVFIILLIPLWVIVSLSIIIDDGFPVFFKQDRLGKGGKIFTLYKFRTMYNVPRNVDREILAGDADVTKTGHYLRRFKIDELPQLFSVLSGKLSLVGPRPCMPELMQKFNEDGYNRLLVKPGLTGLSQINGNIYLSWEDRWKFDSIYVKEISFILDMKILIQTVLVIIFGEEKYIKNE